MKSTNQAGALLAGGKSRRMGRDKATLPWKGRSFAEIQCDKLRQLNLDPLLVSAPEKPFWLPEDFRWIPDSPSFVGAGPLAGLLALAQQTKAEHLFILAVDLPRFPEAFFQNQAPILESGRGWIPEIQGRLQPLAACYPRTFLLEIEACLRRRENRVLSWVEPGIQCGILETLKIPKFLENAFANVNTPEDLEALQKS